MPLINSIPDIFKGGFKELAALSEVNFTTIKKHLADAPLVSTIEKLAALVSSNNGLELLDIDKIFESVGSLVAFIEKKEIVTEVIQDVASLCEDYEIVSAKDRRKFKARLTFLINNKQIYYSAKADKLVTNYGNVFIQSRIISDIRPVFDTEIENELKAGVIIHNLNIHYQSSEDPFHKDITLTLTLDDIKSLKEVLDRAEKKDFGLQDVFKKATIKNLNENSN